MTAATRAPRSAAAVARQQRSVGRTLTIRAALRALGHPVRTVRTRRQADGRTVTAVWPAAPVPRDTVVADLALAAHRVAAVHRWIEHVQTSTHPTPHVRVHGRPTRLRIITPTLTGEHL